MESNLEKFCIYVKIVVTNSRMSQLLTALSVVVGCA